MKYNILLLLTACLLFYAFGSHEAHGQVNRQHPEVSKLMEQAKAKMAEGDFQQANLVFRKMLALKTVLPTEMSYLFAETLFKVGQYENSMNFLKKYQQLTDRGSDYYPLSLELEKQLNEKLRVIHECALCNRSGYRLVACTACDQSGKTVQTCSHCRGHGITTCSVCTGAGVVISKNQFEEKEYRSCEKCASKGFIACPVCQGKKEIELQCQACHGSGMRATSELCDHVHN